MTELERSSLSSLLTTLGEYSIDDSLVRPPRYWKATGKTEILVPLAWMVVTLVGAAALFFVKEFGKGIASELGKKLVESYSQRAKENETGKMPTCPVVVVLERNPSSHIPILIPWALHELPYDSASALTELIEHEVEAKDKRGGVVYWSKKQGRWVLEEQDKAGLGQLRLRGDPRD